MRVFEFAAPGGKVPNLGNEVRPGPGKPGFTFAPALLKSLRDTTIQAPAGYEVIASVRLDERTHTGLVDGQPDKDLSYDENVRIHLRDMGTGDLIFLCDLLTLNLRSHFEANTSIDFCPLFVQEVRGWAHTLVTEQTGANRRALLAVYERNPALSAHNP